MRDDENNPQSGHTPGPWHVDGTGIRALVRGADLTVVALRHRLPGNIHEANARLIAAAPELLAALEAVRFYCIPGMNWTDEIGQELLAKADAAIAKVHGKEYP